MNHRSLTTLFLIACAWGTILTQECRAELLPNTSFENTDQVGPWDRTLPPDDWTAATGQYYTYYNGAYGYALWDKEGEPRIDDPATIPIPAGFARTGNKAIGVDGGGNDADDFTFRLFFQGVPGAEGDVFTISGWNRTEPLEPTANAHSAFLKIEFYTRKLVVSVST